MTDIASYAVFIHAGALEALGEAIKPYLSDGLQGPHLTCKEIDSGGTFFEMVVASHAADGAPVDVELMIPAAMVRLVISMHSEGAFGFPPPVAHDQVGQGDGEQRDRSGSTRSRSAAGEPRGDRRRQDTQ